MSKKHPTEAKPPIRIVEHPGLKADEMYFMNDGSGEPIAVPAAPIPYSVPKEVHEAVTALRVAEKRLVDCRTAEDLAAEEKARAFVDWEAACEETKGAFQNVERAKAALFKVAAS